jgi:NHL repeat
MKTIVPLTCSIKGRCLMLLLLTISTLSNAQHIYTVAGGNTGDGLPAVNAGLNGATGICKSSDGIVYIADATNNRIRKVNPAGIITTIAGNGKTEYSGDGGLAVNAGLFNPSSVVIDNTGNLIICDRSNNRIRKVDAATGIITTIAGNGNAGFSGDGGPALLASFSNPQNAFADTAGNIYISDAGNQRVRKINAVSGIVTTIAGSGATGFSGDGTPALSAAFNFVRWVYADRAGNLFIADQNNNRVRKVAAASGTITTIAGNGASGYSGDNGAAVNAQLSSPVCISGDTAGNIFVGGFFAPAVRKIDAAGIISTVAGGAVNGFSGDGGPALAAQFNSPLFVFATANNELFVADPNTFRVRRIDANGIIFPFAGADSNPPGDGGPATAAGITRATGICFDRKNNMFITERTPRIRKVDALTGVITTIAGDGIPGFSGDNGPAINARLNGPFFSCADTAGNILVADALNYRIRKINTTTGIITTIAGNGNSLYNGDGIPAINASFVLPVGICTDKLNNIYISDENRIRKIDGVTGIITTIAGNSTEGYSGDNGPAVLGLLSGPVALCIDTASNLYFTEQGNYTVRKINLNTGIITTVTGNGSSGFTGDNGPAAQARIRLPYGIGTDKAANIYFVDNGSNRIRKIDALDNIITTVAGNGIRGYSGDSSLAVNARFRGNGLAVDTAGNVYTVDVTYNNVRKVAVVPSVSFVFPGNGDWDDPVNWSGGIVPPLILADNTEIIIDPVPGGICSLNRVQQIKSTARLIIRPGKKLQVNGNLVVQQ